MMGCTNSLNNGPTRTSSSTKVRCDVRGEGGNTTFFDCPSSLKQGCILRPMLFSYLIQVVRNVLVYGDTGKHELHVKSVLSSIRYWLKNVKMKNHIYRIARKLYDMMLMNEHENSWVSKVKNILFYCNL